MKCEMCQRQGLSATEAREASVRVYMEKPFGEAEDRVVNICYDCCDEGYPATWCIVQDMSDEQAALFAAVWKAIKSGDKDAKAAIREAAAAARKTP
ncbi:MAG: hypothetical protein JRI89_14770 [Deltaproteobacteria bacterium]|nr:hypothetical protein [Deltaproteobacteria bacterium]